MHCQIFPVFIRCVSRLSDEYCHNLLLRKGRDLYEGTSSAHWGETPNGEFMGRLCGQLLELLKRRGFLKFSWNYFWRILNIRKYTKFYEYVRNPNLEEYRIFTFDEYVNVIFDIPPIMTNVIFAWKEYENRTWIQIWSWTNTNLKFES